MRKSTHNFFLVPTQSAGTRENFNVIPTKAGMTEMDNAMIKAKNWRSLVEQLKPGMNADENEFINFDPEEIIKTAKKEKRLKRPSCRLNSRFRGNDGAQARE